MNEISERDRVFKAMFFFQSDVVLNIASTVCLPGYNISPLKSTAWVWAKVFIKTKFIVFHVTVRFTAARRNRVRGYVLKSKSNKSSTVFGKFWYVTVTNLVLLPRTKSLWLDSNADILLLLPTQCAHGFNATHDHLTANYWSTDDFVLSIFSANPVCCKNSLNILKLGSIMGRERE